MKRKNTKAVLLLLTLMAIIVMLISFVFMKTNLSLILSI